MEIIRQYIRERVTVEDCGHTSACWVWARCTRDGYGRADIANRTYQAHRVSYEAHVGPIADGLELDHLCCISNCVNPDHLEPVTREENLRRKHVRRGYTIGGKGYVRVPRGQRKPAPPPTHCRRGHEYTPENLAWRKNGTRRCLTCHAKELARYAAWKKAKRAAARISLMAGGVSQFSGDPSTHSDALTHRAEAPTP